MSPSGPTLDSNSTATLILRLRAGESDALGVLLERCRPFLQRWARGRLPLYARDLNETEDLVQATLLEGASRAATFDPRGSGAFLGYLRQILLNKLRDEIRRSKVRSGKETLDPDNPAHQVVAEERRTKLEDVDAYERALDQLERRSRDAVILRFEFGMTFAEIAGELDMPSADAARMKVVRAIEKLSLVMDDQ